MQRLLVLFLAVLLLPGCAGIRNVGHPRGLVKPKIPNSAAVFGYIDMSDAGGFDIDDVILVRLDGDKPELLRANPDYPDGVTVNQRRPGYFWASDLPPGEYQLAEVAGVGYHGSARNYANGGWTRDSFTLDDSQRKATYVKITKSGIYYMGAFKITDKGQGKKFGFRELGAPSEGKALKRMLHRSYDPYWKAMVQKRLNQVGG